jgi:sulfite exporter TauE/SafE
MVLRLASGLLVIFIGLNLLFNWNFTSFLEAAGSGIWKRISPLARHVLPIESPARAVAAGFLWGALPCGLVYSSVAIAATSGSMVSGAFIMFFFWLGTVPTLILAGASAEKLHRWKSLAAFRRFAGVIMISIGILAMAPIRMLIH